MLIQAGPFRAAVFKLAATPPTAKPLMWSEHNRHLQASLSDQTVVGRCEPIQPSCTADPGLSESLPSVAAASDEPLASPHCVSSSPGTQPYCFRPLWQ
ncbi:hypothetical protein Baya_2332 [Bagarius yarrelli]|uniref:Uncharacterized protein n=1 Tax=Bagarius yarrelli TaxID=175774 RepID=A0A556TNQ4_BAGYA|nr:hypothetical protein Baya_2332 [Bagarius yarrelli]